jgi:hypothetical protein
MEERELTLKEKKYILSGLEKGISDDIERVLEIIKVPKKINKNVLDQIKTKIDDLLKEELPRRLTEQEIEEIVSSIPLLPCTIRTISEFNNEQLKQNMRKQLSQQKYLVKEGTIEMIKKMIYMIYMKAVVPAGSSVGSTGGMSVSQQITQAVLDAIHSSGTKTNREANFRLIKKLIEMGKEPEYLKYTVHFTDKNLVAEEISVIGDMLKGINVDDFLISKNILSEIPKNDILDYKNYGIAYGKNINPDNLRNRFMRLVIDINKCFLYNTSIEEIIDVIEKNTEDGDFETTVICIGSSLEKGFIDIHANPDYIEYSVANFSNLGKRIGDCSDIKKEKDEDLLEEAKVKVGDMELDEMTGIFLKVILGDCLGEMKVKGIAGITDVMVSDTVMMDKTFVQNRVYSERDIERFSEKPYSLDLEEIKRLWNIKVKKDALFFDGISHEKIRKAFEVCGMKIIEDSLEKSQSMIILMPEKRTEKYYDKDGKEKYIYQKRNGIYYDIRGEKEEKEVNDQDYKPKILMTNKRSFEKQSLSNLITKYSESEKEDFLSSLPEFSEIYRATSYNYAIIEGKDIVRDLFSNKLIDHQYLFPENARAVRRMFGIESARFYLIRKYLNIGFLKDINPLNVLLLIDFQTSFGTLIPIRSTEIYKKGDSVLAEVSFEKQNTILKNASAFGEEDDTTSVGSRVITGRPCLNGTGSVDVSYDPFYLNNPENKYTEEETENIEEKIYNDDVLGPCLNSGEYVLPSNIDAEKADNPMLLSDRNMKPVVCEKQTLPSPPRMNAPKSISSRSTKRTTIFRREKINVEELPDIPDAPEFVEEEFFPAI